MARSRYWEYSHKPIMLSPDNFSKLKSMKGNMSYDKLMGKMLRKIRLEDLL